MLIILNSNNWAICIFLVKDSSGGNNALNSRKRSSEASEVNGSTSNNHCDNQVHSVSGKLF